MRIVNIEDYFHPDTGYQINILAKFFARMGHEVHIVTSEINKVPNHLLAFFGSKNIESRDEEYSNKYNVMIHRRPSYGFYSGRAIYRRGFYSYINSLKPDILFIHGNDTLNAMHWLLKDKKNRYPIVMDSHMLSMATNNKFASLYRFFYRRVFAPIIIRRNIPVIRTQNDPYVWEKLGIPLKQAPWISVGSDTMLFHPDAEARRKFREEHSISEDEFVIVYAGKLDESKGGLLLANAIKEKFNSNKNIVFLIVGDAKGNYGSEVEKTLSESENRVLRFPTQRYTDLAKFYQASDLAVFPKQCSLSFYDVQACGLPVISENNNINIERCSHGNGWTFISGDLNDLILAINKVLRMSPEELKVASKNAFHFVDTNYNYRNLAREYETILLSVAQ